MKKLFIGIDFSKEKIEIFFKTAYDIVSEAEIPNIVTNIKKVHEQKK